MSQYQLTTELLKQSKASNWDEAKLEWELANIVRVEDAETCLCGHFPIIEVCTIHNKETGEDARVGNYCVKKFIDKSDKIFRSVMKVIKDSKKSVNSETLDLSVKNKWISGKEHKFYMDIMRRRSLSSKQKDWKMAINNKIVSRINRKT
jgi:hypothetical protein